MSQLRFACRHQFASGFELDVAFATNHLVTSLFGPSGAGKTTMLSIFAGLLRPREVQISLDDTIVADSASAIWLPPEARHLGYVFQDHLLFPHRTVEGNLRYGERAAERDRPSISLERVAQVLELGPLLKRRPAELSGGQRQRVALGRALLCQPRWLLMDEPLAALDESIKSRILNYLERVVHEFQIPTLFVSHSQAEVRRFAQWVVVVENGRIVSQGEPTATLDQPRTMGWKHEEGPTNLLRVECVRDEQGRWLGRWGTQSLWLPPSDEYVAHATAYVQFSPNQVILARHDLAGISTRNHLRGHVRQMVPVGDAVYVAIDAEQIFWAHLTREAVAEMQLAAGMEVCAFVKTLALQVG